MSIYNKLDIFLRGEVVREIYNVWFYNVYILIRGNGK